MEGQNEKGSNVVIEVKANNTTTIESEEVKAAQENIEVISAESLSEEELESLSDGAIKEEETIVDETPLEENPDGLAGEAMSLLGKFKEYVGGDKFDKVCADASQRHGVDKSVVKNAFVKNALGTIANALNLTVSIAGDIIKGAVGFIDTIISTVVNFTTSTLHKLVKVLTLNCGTLEF
jgi:SepF-like predicted cell division protein (DUF552 family)